MTFVRLLSKGGWKTLRIGMLCDMYKPHISGVTIHIALNKKRMEELGHEVFVFTFGSRDYDDEEPNVVRSYGFAWGETGYQMGWRYSAEARRLLATMDVLHVHHPFQSGRLALTERGRSDTPVVATNHSRYDLYADAYASFVPRAVRQAYIRSYLRRYYSRVDLAICPSQGVADVLRKSFGVTAPIEIVRNGVDTRPFRQPRDEGLRTSLGFGPDDVVAVYIGRLGPEKRVLLLLEAFVSASDASPHLRLLLAGDGPEREALQARACELHVDGKVVFAGKVDYERVPAYARVGDLFCTASVSETHPLTVIEGLAAGLPVVAVASPGISETVEPGRTGFLTTDSPTELAAALARLGNEPALRSSMAAAAATSARKYDIECTADELLARYEEAIRRRR